MTGFEYDRSSFAVRGDIAASHVDAWAQLGQPGTWWTGVERLAIAARARRAFVSRATPPWLRDLPDVADGLDQRTTRIVDKVALDAGAIDRDWASSAIDDVGDGAYVELIAVASTVVMIDIHAEAIGVERVPFPPAIDGEPSRTRSDGLGEIGAHVLVLEPFPFANVARALSLVPDANTLFRTVSVPAYSAPGFDQLQWDTPLTRPQVELIASRVAALNECFY